MKMRKVLTAALAAAMLFTTVPPQSFAAGGDSTGEQGKLIMNKTATLTDDGSYTINMEAFATGKTTTQTIEKGVPLDIVLVMDQSGSMADELGDGKKLDALKTAATNFVDKVYQNGQKYGITHRIGMVGFGSIVEPDYDGYDWHGTGVFDENGNFVQYEGKDPAAQESYNPYNGELDPNAANGTYYVKVDSKYIPLTYNKGAENYVPVNSPATDRTDLYGKVNGQYEKAVYGEYTTTLEATNPTKEDGKTYYDAKGNQLTWVEEKTTKQEYVRTESIQAGKEYWIDFNEGTGTAPDWHKISHKSNGWRDDAGSWLAYTVSPDNRHFEYSGISGYYLYTAYTKKLTETPTGNWFLSADGKTPVTFVYEKVTKTGWNVNGTPVKTLYELQKDAGKWQYTVKEGKKHVTHDLTNEQVYTKTSKSLYSSALVPVADGKNGSGSKRGSFATAIDQLKADGATRVATGVELGNKIFDANPLTEADKAAGRQRVMIIFTDGKPGASGYDSEEANRTLTEIKKTKAAGVTVYTVGLYDSASKEQTTFMNKLSSNYDQDNKEKVADKYYHQVTNAAALDGVFQSIQEDISGSTTAVDLTTTSILRDIMAEGFELTANSVVTVKVVPGDATNAADPSRIKWGTPVKVCRLTKLTDGKSKTGTYTDPVDGSAMNLKASVYMKNPESGKKNLHTVDVTGFDYKDQYIAKAHKGSKLMVEITGIQVLPTVATNQNLFTNHDQSGIWAPLTEGGKRELKAPFPQKPETYIPSKSFVMDYAKPTQLTASDFDVASKNLDKNGYVPFASANTAIAQTYGNAALAGGKLTYSPKTTNWDGYDTFYVFGTTNDKTVKAASANANGNVWAKVNVIPANNVYYEDTFVTDGSTDTVGIYYTGAWTEVSAGPNSGAVEDSSNPNDNQGWIPVLKGETGDTDGTSHGIDKSQIGQLTGKGSKVASASFAFTGTGVDVYSRTNGQTGMILAYLKDASGKAINVQIIDTLSASGEYYNVPTLSLYQDGKGVDLPYGKYTLELYVTTQVQERYEYYLDGIRIYNPLGHGSDDVVNNAYGPDEQNATFIEVRDKLLDANSFSGDSTKVNGPVFIDQILEGQGDPTDKPGTSTSTTVVGTYKDYGPKNEVYLAPGQSVTFKVNQTPGNHYFVGLKSPTDAAAMAGYPGADGYRQMDSISHTGDMYYEVAPTSDGFITISNDSRGKELLAITKLKVTNPNAPVAAAAVFAETDTPALLMATQTFMAQTPDPDVDPDFDRITIHDIFHSGYNPQEIRALLKDLLEQLFAQIEADLSNRVPTISEIISGDFSKLEGLFGHIGSWHPHW